MLRRFLFIGVFWGVATPAVFAGNQVRILQVDGREFPRVKLEVSIAKVIPLLNISKESVSVMENGWPIKTFDFRAADETNMPRYLTLLVDASRSLSESDFKEQIRAVRHFIESLSPKDSLTVFSFQDRVIRHCENVEEKKKMLSCVNAIRRGGSKTLLRDALYESISFSARLKRLRTAVILFTDGNDEGSVMTLEDVISEVKKYSIPVFVAATGHKQKLQDMIRLSRLSGGRVYHAAKTSELKKVYGIINEILKNTYLIEYESNGALTGSKIKKEKLFLSNVKVAVQYDGISDEDSVSFTHTTAGGIPWRSMFFEDERYVLYIAGSIVLLLLLIIILLLTRRPKVNVEVSQPEPKAPIMPPEEEELVRRVMPEKKQFFAKEPPPREYFHAYLVEKEGPKTGKKYKLVWETVNIGYSDENSIVLDDPTVSPLHARIERTRNGFILYDMLSEGGVFLNGKKLLRPKKLHDFDEIQLGRTKLIFRRASGIDV